MSESNQALMEAPRKFNLFSRNDPVQSFFGVKPLDASEANAIEKLLIENLQPNIMTEKQVNDDVDQLKTLTSEIKTINKQGALLIGERVFKAREILKSYVDGTFVKWIDGTFDSRRTAYNMLSYYELYLSLPNQMQEDFKKMPQKAAYMLASREGNIEKKAEIINAYHHLKANELMCLIDEQIPSLRRASSGISKFSFFEIFKFLKRVHSKKRLLSHKDRENLRDMLKMINNILE